MKITSIKLSLNKKSWTFILKSLFDIPNQKHTHLKAQWRHKQESFATWTLILITRVLIYSIDTLKTEKIK